MDLVRSRFADGIDHSARCPAILRRVVSGKHREFLNRIDTQADADDAAWPAVAVIINAESVEPVIVLCGPASGDGQLRPKTPVPAYRAVFEGHLSFNRIDAGRKSRQ